MPTQFQGNRPSRASVILLTEHRHFHSGKKLRRLPIDRALRLPSTRFENSSRINRVGDAVVEGVSKGTKVKVNK